MSFCIIGDQDTVLGYRFAGVLGTVVETAEEAGEAFTSVLQGKDCRILLLTEEVEDWLGDAVSQHRLQAEPPYIVVVEDIWGPKGERASLESLIHEAVGIRIAPEEK